MIKKLVILFMLLVLAGCGSSVKETTVSTTLNEDYTDALSIRSQLILGTLKLQETEFAITKEQAAVLLPLWQASRSLTRSGTSATEEVEAILGQIQEAMTSEQLEAIVEMKFVRADTQIMSQALGLSTGTGEGTGEGGGGGQGKNLSEAERATRQAEKAESGSVGTIEELLDKVIETLESK